MSSKEYQKLQKLLTEGFSQVKKDLAAQKEILTGLKGEIDSVRDETQEVKGMAEKNSREGKDREKRVAVLESQMKMLISSDQDRRRRNGRR